MNRLKSWLPTLIFWALFLLSLGLSGRYRWIDTIWYVALLAFLLFVSGYSLIQIFRHRHETDCVSYRGIPRWLERFSLDEDRPAPNKRK